MPVQWNEDLLIKQCKNLGIALLDEEDITKIREDSEEIRLGEGVSGSCSRYTGKQGDLTIKTFFNNSEYADIVKEIRWLGAVQGITGVQEVVGVQTKDKMIVSKFAGESLLSYSSHNPLTYDDLKQIMLQLAQIVRKMLRLGLTHNDIKIDNICVNNTPDGLRIVLIDFGITSELNTRKFKKPKPGTKPCMWMAPEVSGGGVTSETSDIYSMAMLFRLLTRKQRIGLPRDVFEWIEAARSRDPTQRPSVLKLIHAILLRDKMLKEAGLPEKQEVAKEGTSANKRERSEDGTEKEKVSAEERSPAKKRERSEDGTEKESLCRRAFAI